MPRSQQRYPHQHSKKPAPMVSTARTHRHIPCWPRFQHCLRKSYSSKVSMAFDILGCVYTLIGAALLSNDDLMVRRWMNTSAMAVLTLSTISALLRLRDHPRAFLPSVERRCPSWFISPFAFFFYHVILLFTFAVAYNSNVTDYVDHSLTEAVNHNVTALLPALSPRDCACIIPEKQSMADQLLIPVFFALSFGLKWLGAWVLICDGPNLNPSPAHAQGAESEQNGSVQSEAVSRRRHSGEEAKPAVPNLFKEGNKKLGAGVGLESSSKDRDSSRELSITDDESLSEMEEELREANLVKEIKTKIKTLEEVSKGKASIKEPMAKLKEAVKQVELVACYSAENKLSIN